MTPDDVSIEVLHQRQSERRRHRLKQFLGAGCCLLLVILVVSAVLLGLNWRSHALLRSAERARLAGDLTLAQNYLQQASFLGLQRLPRMREKARQLAYTDPVAAYRTWAEVITLQGTDKALWDDLVHGLNASLQAQSFEQTAPLLEALRKRAPSHPDVRVFSLWGRLGQDAPEVVRQELGSLLQAHGDHPLGHLLYGQLWLLERGPVATLRARAALELAANDESAIGLAALRALQRLQGRMLLERTQQQLDQALQAHPLMTSGGNTLEQP
jgi:hypothetical protein